MCRRSALSLLCHWPRETRLCYLELGPRQQASTSHLLPDGHLLTYNTVAVKSRLLGAGDEA